MIGVCVAEVCACVRERMQRYLRRGREGGEGGLLVTSSTVDKKAHDAGKKYITRKHRPHQTTKPLPDACSLALLVEKAYAVHVRKNVKTARVEGSDRSFGRSTASAVGGGGPPCGLPVDAQPKLVECGFFLCCERRAEVLLPHPL